MPEPVVVELDRQLGALDAERAEELRLVAERLHRRDGLAHPPEDDPRTLALERHGHDAHAGLEPDLTELQRRAEHERGAECRMAGERDLGHRREDPHARVAAGLGRVHEDGLGELQLPRERLQQLFGEVARIREHGELVALERRVREDVADDVAMSRHRRNLLPRLGANPNFVATERPTRTAGGSRSPPTPPC